MKYSLSIICFLLATTVLPAQMRLYVNHAATGANDGSSWADALNDLQSALQLANSGDEVWVAKGVYYPTQTADRYVSFEPRSGVRLYGGFNGHEGAIGQRDWSANVTVLSGDIGILGDSTDNSLSVVYLYQPDSMTVLDGFTICYGVADEPLGVGSARDRAICGGGLYIEAGTWDALPKILNCRFWRNAASSFGGGVMLNGASVAGVAPMFTNCLFEENRSMGNGGGVARFGGSWVEQGREFEHCHFVRNWASNNGGGLHYSDTQGPNTISIYGCVFMGNVADNKGGGTFFLTGKSGKSGLSIQHCVFESNIAHEGAAVEIFTNGNDFDGSVIVDSCSFTSNVSTQAINSSSIIYSDMIGPTQAVVNLSNSRFEENNSANFIININWSFSLVQLETVSICRDTGALFSAGAVSRVEVNNSRFSSNSTSILGNVGFKSFIPSPYLRYSNCLFDKNQPPGTSLYYFASYLIDTVFVTNCTFADNDNDQVVLTSTEKMVFKNVITTKAPSVLYFPPLSELHFANCFLDFPDCQSSPPNVTCGPGNLFGLDPMFRDPANGDYSLLPCSPLINAGSNAAAAGILTDIAGNPRILEGTVDIGAYEAPAFALGTAPQVSPACVGASNGSLSIAPQHGCEPLAYQWSPNAGNGPELNGLPPGAYAVTVTDGSGRQITDTLTVPETPVPSLSLTAQDIACGTVTGGSLSASVTGGTAPFAYHWSAGLGDQPWHGGLGPGPYALTVSDANGCLDSASATLALVGNLTLSVGAIPISCHGEADAALTVQPANGAPPFDWDWQGWPGNAPTAAPLGPGLYAVTVTDALGCTSSFAFNPVTAPAPLVLGAEGSPQTQSSPPNGAAVVTTTSGGTQPYGYLWDMGQMGHAIGGLLAGTYTVTVTDARGCTATAEVVVELMLSATGEPLGVVLFYPNPAVDWVRALLPTGDWRVEVFDASGRVVRSSGCANGDCVLDLSGLPASTYLLRARDGQRELVGKVVRK